MSDLIDEIKYNYKQIKKKGVFIRKLAVHEQIDRSAPYLKNHWFSNYWSIPKKFQMIVFRELLKQIEADKLMAELERQQ